MASKSKLVICTEQYDSTRLQSFLTFSEHESKFPRKFANIKYSAFKSEPIQSTIKLNELLENINFPVQPISSILLYNDCSYWVHILRLLRALCHLLLKSQTNELAAKF